MPKKKWLRRLAASTQQVTREYVAPTKELRLSLDPSSFRSSDVAIRPSKAAFYDKLMADRGHEAGADLVRLLHPNGYVIAELRLDGAVVEMRL